MEDPNDGSAYYLIGCGEGDADADADCEQLSSASSVFFDGQLADNACLQAASPKCSYDLERYPRSGGPLSGPIRKRKAPSSIDSESDSPTDFHGRSAPASGVGVGVKFQFHLHSTSEISETSLPGAANCDGKAHSHSHSYNCHSKSESTTVIASPDLADLKSCSVASSGGVYRMRSRT